MVGGVRGGASDSPGGTRSGDRSRIPPETLVWAHTLSKVSHKRREKDSEMGLYCNLSGIPTTSPLTGVNSSSLLSYLRPSPPSLHAARLPSFVSSDPAILAESH